MEPRQQQFVQFLPDPGGLPVAQSSPAGHAAAPKLRGQILPRDAGAQDEEDAFKTGAIVARLAAGMALSPRFDGNERFDQRPQFVIQQWLGHGCASLHHMAKSNPRAIVLGVLKARYERLTECDYPLFAFPYDQVVAEKVMIPLHQAKVAFILGYELGCIAMCGMVGEMLASLRFKMSRFGSGPDAWTPSRQERLLGRGFEHIEHS